MKLTNLTEWLGYFVAVATALAWAASVVGLISKGYPWLGAALFVAGIATEIFIAQRWL